MAPAPPVAAIAAVPPLLGSVRRRRLVAENDDGRTWEAWDTSTGNRLLVWIPTTGDVVGDGGTDSPLLPREVSEEGAPHVRIGPFDHTLAELAPAEDPLDAVSVARLALEILRGLAWLHARGDAHGHVDANHVVVWRGRWRLASARPRRASPAGDLAAFGALLAAIDAGPIGELGAGFAESPPPSAPDAARLVLQVCAGLLAREHHALVLRARAAHTASRIRRLRAVAARLGAACPPPAVHACVRAEDDALLIVVSDGLHVSVLRQGHDLRALAEGAGYTVLGPEGLDPIGARALVRAWSTRDPDSEPRRAEAQALLGCDDASLERLLRWVRASSRLRIDRLVLATR